MKNYFKGTSFLDLLFNILLLFFALFILAYTQIRVIEVKGKIETKAEFVVTLTWDADSIDDIDLWVIDPLQETVFFRRKSHGMTHLDRDDRGDAYDAITLPNGQVVKYEYNQEITTIRGIIPGEWIVNLHMYHKRTDKPAHVNVTVVKLNPEYKEICKKDLIMAVPKEEVTIVRFTVEPDGTVSNLSDLPFEIVGEVLANMEISHNSSPESWERPGI